MQYFGMMTYINSFTPMAQQQRSDAWRQFSLSEEWAFLWGRLSSLPSGPFGKGRLESLPHMGS
jgi:hypothetical protein